MPTVFINYRAREQAGYAALLDRELAARFGRDAVFRASRSIAPGDDFADAILGNLRKCAVLLAVIGPDWLRRGVRPPESEGGDDWVHREIAEALRAGVRVIPVLVEDAAMPGENDLPYEIVALARCQYVRLHHRSVETDLCRLVDELDRLCPQLRRGRRAAGVIGDHLAKLFRHGDPPARACGTAVIRTTIRRVGAAEIRVRGCGSRTGRARFVELSVSSVIRYHDPGGRPRHRCRREMRHWASSELRSRLHGRAGGAGRATPADTATDRRDG